MKAQLLKAKAKLASVKMYGRNVSEFLLPDQMEFIEKAMVEFAQEQVNGIETSHDKALHKHIVRGSYYFGDMEKACEEGIYEGALRQMCKDENSDKFIHSDLKYYMKGWD